MYRSTTNSPPVRQRTPTQDERRVCQRCGQPFRCPTAQIERFTCGPCEGKHHDLR